MVGAGHNGLVAAAYLARAGLRTAVVERREIVGGACTTEEFAPGFLASPGAYVLSLLRPAIWRDFSLRARGLEVLEAAPTLNVFRDGARLTLHDDDARDRARARPLRPSRRGGLPGLSRRAGRDRRPARRRGSTARRPGRPGWLGRDSAAGDRPQRRRRPAATGSRPRSCSRPRRATTSSSAFAPSTCGAALGWDSISNTLAGPSTPGTAYSLLHEHAAASLGRRRLGLRPRRHGHGHRAARRRRRRGGGRDRHRGAGRADPRRGRPRERGAARRGRRAGGAARWSRTRTRSGPCSGWSGATGSTRRRPTAIEAYRCEGASLKINLALGELPRIEGTPAGAAAPPPRADPVHAAARRHGRRPGGRPARDPGAGPARGALRPERPRPVARAAGAPRRHPRLSLPALPPRRVGLGRRARAGRRSPARRARRR